MRVNNLKRRGTNNWSTLSLVELFGLSGFRKGFTTLDHILTLQALIEECRALNERIYVCFVNFLKPSTVCLLNLSNNVLLDM